MKRKMHDSDRGVWLGIVFMAILIGAVALMADFIKKENARKQRWHEQAAILMKSVTNSGAYTWEELHIEKAPDGSPMLVGSKVPTGGTASSKQPPP